MQISTIKAFLTVCDEKSFSKAARLLYISQPAMTQQIRRMESELGFTLIEREKKGSFALTRAGKDFYAYGKEAVAAYEKAVHRGRLLSQNISREIQIAMHRYDVSLLTYETLARFDAIHPECTLQIEYDPGYAMLDALKEGKIDACFMAEPLSLPDDLEFIPCVTDHIACALQKGHPLSDRSEISLADLRRYGACIQDPPQGKDMLAFNEMLHIRHPNIHTEGYRKFAIPYGKTYRKIIMIEEAMGKRLIHNHSILFSPSRTIVKGYVIHWNAPEAVRDFALLNQSEEAAALQTRNKQKKTV
jgi:DNA-binding transcriptional LysR family regulator